MAGARPAMTPKSTDKVDTDPFVFPRFKGQKGFAFLPESPPTEGRKRRHGWRRQGTEAAWKPETGC
jgi:hypothetical protein